MRTNAYRVVDIPVDKKPKKDKGDNKAASGRYSQIVEVLAKKNEEAMKRQTDEEVFKNNGEEALNNNEKGVVTSGD